MAQFDVYRHPVSELREEQPYLMELQSSFVNSPEARIVIPLARLTVGAKPMSNLNPELEVQGELLVLDTLYITSYEPSDLRRPVANLRNDADAIWSALDYALHGY